MIQNKAALLNLLSRIAAKKKQQAYLLEDLVHSLQQHYKEKSFKEWMGIAKPVIEKLEAK
jgi:hypothetical protein